MLKFFLFEYSIPIDANKIDTNAVVAIAKLLDINSLILNFLFRKLLVRKEFKEVIIINYFLRWNYPDQVQGSSKTGSSQPVKTSSPTFSLRGGSLRYF